MVVNELLKTASLAASEFRCSARKGEPSFNETRDAFSISYVLTGSFGLHSQARSFEAALWIDAESKNPITLDDAAAEVGVSPFHSCGNSLPCSALPRTNT